MATTRYSSTLLLLLALLALSVFPEDRKKTADNSNAIWRLQRTTQNLQQTLTSKEKSLLDSIRLLNGKLLDLRNRQVDYEHRFVPASVVDSISKINDQRTLKIRRSLNLYFALLVFLLLAGAASLLVFIRRTVRRAFDPAEMPAREMQVLVGHVKSALGKPAKADPQALPPAETQEVDHELPVRVAEEVFRMRLRLSRMPGETKGLSALLNAVARLEDELNIKGYAIVDLTGQPYFDEMTVSVKEFIPQDDLPAGQKRILRMIKPQVKHLDSIIAYGEVEVAMAADDLAQR